ncbi:MAG TPA: DPP IV N-terminal domain-containing protein, partial [Chitinophagaceae bacterium]|nr:DPP IV N-terminal domain-containing protein [Chitinophagaceae bacterium]
MRTWIILLLILPFSLLAQKKKITLEAIYKNGTFRANSVPGFVEEEISKLVKADDVIDEKGIKIPLDDVLLSPDRNKLLVFTGREKIYRRSSRAFAYLHDIISKKTTKLNTEKLLHSTFSPDGKRIAFVKDNDLFLYEIDGEKLIAITTDGKWNHIINGNCDWVYEEEFEFTKAYEWSPNGRYIAYYRFDESNVKEFQFTQFDNSYNSPYTYKYPKAGEVNSIVEIHIYEIATNKKVNTEFEKGDIYIPRIKWTKEDEQLVVFWMNRHQNTLKLLATNAGTGASRVLYEEKNKYFVEINDDWMWLRDGKHFLFTSEMHGFRHIYIYSNDGKTRVQLSHGNHEVTEINGVDENNRLVYFTMAYPRPMDRNFFVTDYSGKKTFQLTTGEGWHKVELNADFSRYYDFHSDINTPKSVSFNEITITKKKMVSTRVLKIVDENT